MRVRSASLFAAACALGTLPAAAAPAKKPAARPAAARAAAPAEAGTPVKISIHPPKIKLSGRGMAQRFLVFGHYAGGLKKDLTDAAKVATAGSGRVQVDPKEHRLQATANGDVTLTATVGAQKAVMEVTVQGVEQKPEWSFANEIVPIFTKAGCNSGGCHGSPSGRGGFRLSLFGYEPDYDYDMVTKDKNGARISKNQPSTSLLLTKPAMKVPHQGGKRFDEGSEFFTRIQEWLRDGAPKQPEFDARLSHIEIYPTDWTLQKPGEQQQILVMAVRDDGTTQDVTQYARFTTNDDQVAEVNDDGLLEAVKPGETSIMIRYLGGVGVVNVKVPREALPASAYANFKPANYIDELTLAKFKEVRIPPSDPVSDEEFLRRAYIDTTGLIPTADEARAFLDDKDPAKREKLVDRLLNSQGYVDYWTLKWSDLLRNNQQAKKDKGIQVYYRWIRDSVRDNKPWDRFAKELITATGSAYRSGPANWYNTGEFGGDYPLLMASATSQVFLGIRIDCARCHNHPFEAWSQMDYYGLAAFFARTGVKNGADEDEKIFVAGNEGDVKHPRTNVVIQSKFLGGDLATFTAEEDRREKLAEWITTPSRNPWFQRSIANRLWNNFFGRGIVNPVDDYRLTNPASNEKLLETLGEKVVAYKFDLKKLMRDIMLSRTYQTSSLPNKQNVDDRLYNSHALPRRLYAEVLLDAIAFATDTQRKIGPYDRAVAIVDNRLGDGQGFLELFGRAKREVACECERSEETNVTMVLNLLNGGTVNQRIGAPGGRVERVVAQKKEPKAVVEEFYLSTLSRRPTAKEEAAALKLLTSAPNLREGAEDLMWGLLNTKEFMFNH